MQACLQRNVSQRCFIFTKVCPSKPCMSVIFKMIVYKVFSLFPKKRRFTYQTLIHFMCVNKSPCWDHNVLLKTYFIGKTSSLAVLKHSAEF
jgi:hypothetical protein